jgi:antitoxin VapB
MISMRVEEAEALETGAKDEVGGRKLTEGVGGAEVRTATCGQTKSVCGFPRIDTACLTGNPELYIIAIYVIPASRSSGMSIGTVFINNRTQAVRLPVDVRLPEGVHKVEVRVRGNERIIAPVGQAWDSFFLGGRPAVSDDFMSERADQRQSERESL